MAEPDIRVLVGVEGDIGIGDGSGKLIAKTLAQVAKNISANQRPKVTFDLDFENTTKKICKQLDNIAKSIKVSPIDLNIRTNQSSMNSFIEEEYKKLFDSTKNKSKKGELIGQALMQNAFVELGIQKAKDVELTEKQTKADKEREKATKDLSKALQFVGSFDSDKILAQSDNLIDKLGRTDLLPQFNKLKDEAADLNATISRLKGNLDFDDFAKELSDPKVFDENKKIIERVHQYSKDISDFQKSVGTTGSTFNKELRNADNGKLLDNLILKITKFENTNDKFKNNHGLSAEFERIKNALNGLKTSGDFSKVDIDKLDRQFSEFKTNVVSLGQEGQTTFGKLRSQMEKLGVYLSASALLMGAWRQVKQTISTVIELDKVVTDLSVATGMNRKETQELLDTYSELGKELGATTESIAGAADDWLRQGKSIATTNELIKDSLMLSKLGKIDSSEATTALTTMSKAYKIADNEMTSLVDKLTAVDAVSATTAGGIAKSFQETAVSANLAGISIDRMAGYIAIVSEISGDAPESVGTFFRTFLSRMSNIKEGRMIDEDTGEDLSTVESVLKNIGIQLRNDQGQFRNFQDVLDEIAVKWIELEAIGDKVGQTKIASALGLTLQQEKAKILFEHYDEAIKYAEISANSLGTAEEKFNNAYLTSTQASIDAFTAQYEQMANVIWDSGLIKGTFDTGAGFLGALTWIIDNLDTIPTLATVAAGALSSIGNRGKPVKTCDGVRNYLMASKYMPIHLER